MSSEYEREYESQVRQRIQESLAVKETILRDAALVRLIAEVAHRIGGALREGHKVLLFGNGGSAADAQHIAAELVGRYHRERPGLPALALTVNTSSLTAIGNDYNFETIYARQVDALGTPEDIAVAISTSGESGNVLRGVERAKARGLLTVGLTGQKGGRLRQIVDYCICIPSKNTPRIQEAHILLGHIICELVEHALFDELSMGEDYDRGAHSNYLGRTGKS